jgi:hypothetical protein
VSRAAYYRERAAMHGELVHVWIRDTGRCGSRHLADFYTEQVYNSARTAAHFALQADWQDELDSALAAGGVGPVITISFDGAPMVETLESLAKAVGGVFMQNLRTASRFDDPVEYAPGL